MDKTRGLRDYALTRMGFFEQQAADIRSQTEVMDRLRVMQRKLSYTAMEGKTIQAQKELQLARRFQKKVNLSREEAGRANMEVDSDSDVENYDDSFEASSVADRLEDVYPDEDDEEAVDEEEDIDVDAELVGAMRQSLELDE